MIDLPSYAALYERGAHIPDDAFVRAELVVSKEAGASLGGQYFVAVDGSSQWFTFFDPSYGEPCLIRSLNDDARHCIPQSTLSQGFWSGSVAGVDPSVCWRLIAESNSCIPSAFGMAITEMHRVAPVADVVGTSFDTPTFRACLLSAREFMRDPFALTDAVEPGAFPRMAELEVAGALLKRTVWGTADGSALAPVDDARPLSNGDYYCSLGIAVDGKIRCLPQARTDLFADPECTEPLLVLPDPSGPYTRAERKDGRTAIYVPGELFSGESYKKTQSSSRVLCEAGAAKVEPPSVLHRGVEVLPEEFVEYTQVASRQ